MTSVVLFKIECFVVDRVSIDASKGLLTDLLRRFSYSRKASYVKSAFLMYGDVITHITSNRSSFSS